MSGPDARFRTVDADSGFLSQLAEATVRFIATSGNPPPLEWFVSAWVPTMDTTLLAGPGAVGKSYISLQLQAAAALGMPWLGLSVPQCPSLGFYSEDGFEAVANRLHVIARHYRSTTAELMGLGLRLLPRPADTALVSLDGGRRGAALTTTAAWADLRRTLDVLQPGLLVLDNLADFLPVPGFDNTAIRQARRMALDPLCTEHGATTLGLQNVTLNGLRATDEAEGSSGGLAWRDAFRSRLYLRTEQADEDDPEAGRIRILSRIKANNAPDDRVSIKLRWNDGVFDVNLTASDTVSRIEQAANEDWLKDAVIRIVESGRAYSTASNQPNYLPRLLAEDTSRPKRFGEKSIRAAFERLVRADTISIRAVRDPTKGRFVDRVVAVDGHNLRAEQL